MDRDWIDNLRIEHRGENGGMHITVFFRPPCANYELPKYRELVRLAVTVFSDAADPDHRRFNAVNAEVMAWSDEGMERGLTIPHRYRVTVDFDPQTPEPGAGRSD